MKLIIFTKYSRLGASSRLRSFQYVPFYEAAGISCTVAPLFNDVYLQRFYAKKSTGKVNLLLCYLKRFLLLFTVGRYDVVVIEKELFPYMPALAEKLLRLLHVRYIADYDDAIFHNYDLHPSKLIALFLKNKIAGVMRNAATVVAGNEYLASYAKKAGSAYTCIIPTVINTDVYKVNTQPVKEYVVIGWIGSPTTVKYLEMLLPVLNILNDKYAIQLWIVGGKRGIGFKNEVVKEWSEAGEVNLIQQFDIGIMPLQDSPWERGKCGYKLIQYMGCGLPVVGSPVGVNNNIIQHGCNGFKANTQEDWINCLEALITNPALRPKMGQDGRLLIEEQFNTAGAAAKWLQVINETINRHA